MHGERDTVMANKSVCSSVPYTPILYRNECIIVKLFPPSGTGMTLVFQHYRRYKIPRGTPLAGALNTRGGKNLRFSTEIAVYLGNGTR